MWGIIMKKRGRYTIPGQRVNPYTESLDLNIILKGYTAHLHRG